MEISTNLFQKIRNIASDRIGVEKAMKAALSDTIALLDERVFKKGEDANNDQIGTYSAEWAAVRKSRGRQTKFVDFRFEGLLQQSITIMPKVDDNTWAIGFRNAVQSEKAEKIQKVKRKTVFELTQKERKRLISTFLKMLLR